MHARDAPQGALRATNGSSRDRTPELLITALRTPLKPPCSTASGYPEASPVPERPGAPERLERSEAATRHRSATLPPCPTGGSCLLQLEASAGIHGPEDLEDDRAPRRPYPQR